jgi:hypothetical protein
MEPFCLTITSRSSPPTVQLTRTFKHFHTNLIA